MYSLKESKISFEDMFLEIADRNKIKTYNFVFYVPSDSEEYSMAKFVKPSILREEVKSTIKAKLSVQPDYFNNKSLNDIKTDLVDLFEDDIIDLFLGSVGISSVVKLQGDRRKYHMKHIDFMCPVAEENVEKIRRELEDLESGDGLLVISGNSYHFHGLDVMSCSEWCAWMDKLKKTN